MRLRRPSVSIRQSPILLLAFAGLALLMTGCATIPEGVLRADPSTFLERDPDIYLKLSGAALDDFTTSLNGNEIDALTAILAQGKARSGSGTTNLPSEIDQTLLHGIVSKTRTFGMGISGIYDPVQSVNAIFVGEFQPLSLRIAMASDMRWVKTPDGGYRTLDKGMALRQPLPGVVRLVSPATAPPDEQQAAGNAFSAASGVQPYPANFAAQSRDDIFLTFNTPAAFLASSIQGDAKSIPVRAILFSGRRVTGRVDPASGEALYALECRILMKDESTARAYRPVVKFLWAAGVARFFGDGISIGSGDLELEGDIYVARNISASASTLKKALISGLRGG